MNDWTVDYVMSFITWNNVLGATGALFYIVSMSMKTVIPLRITSLVSALCLLGASLLARSLPAIALYALLLPVHSFRLYQMLALIKKVRIAAGTDLSMDWLRPYMKRRKYRKGDILFHKGDLADEMFLAETGNIPRARMGHRSSARPDLRRARTADAGLLPDAIHRMRRIRPRADAAL